MFTHLYCTLSTYFINKKKNIDNLLLLISGHLRVQHFQSSSKSTDVDTISREIIIRSRRIRHYLPDQPIYRA